MIEARDESTAKDWLSSYRFYLRRRPVMLAALAVAAVAFFLAVTALSRAYHEQRDALGDRWFKRGLNDLDAKRFASAVTDFRAALLYSRDNYTYQLDLAEALIGENRTAEASAYLLNLWDRQPEDGLVNLELARISAHQGETEKAVRYYHNAVYAAWPKEREGVRRQARLELIDYLLRTHSDEQAESELIALAANAGDDPAEQQHIGELFLQTHDYERSLSAFRAALKQDRHNAAALAGAGNAAFQLQRFELAHRYLHEAIDNDPNDANSAAQLKLTEAAIEMDPFRPGIPVAERNRIVAEEFGIAGERLKNCPVHTGVAAAPGSSRPSLSDSWTALQPKINPLELQRQPELAETAMDLVFQIERETGATCGEPAGADRVLLLIAKLHEGS